MVYTIIQTLELPGRNSLRLPKRGQPTKDIGKDAGSSQSAVSKHIQGKLSERKKCSGKVAKPLSKTSLFVRASSATTSTFPGDELQPWHSCVKPLLKQDQQAL